MAQIPKIEPKAPDLEWISHFFGDGLMNASAYQIDMPEVTVKLDQNESPWDWPSELKEGVLFRLKQRQWNRYPETLGDELTASIANYAGVPPTCVLTGPGSNYLITILLDAMARNITGKIVIARPSFPLFEMHCRYSGVEVEPWLLDDTFSYQLSDLPHMPEGSLLIFASPNNPTGSSLSRGDLETILKENPESYIIADEAYYEFDGDPATDLLQKYHNLIIIRTLSKTMGAAGVRLGYVLGAPQFIGELKKLRLPFLLNHFAMEAALYILQAKDMKGFIAKNVANVVSERKRIHSALESMGSSHGIWVKPSTGNFLLMRCASQEQCQLIYQGLIRHGVLVRNISSGPGLTACLRVSVGKPEENDQFLSAVKALLI